MTTRITVGRGYRRLKPGERLRNGDEFLSTVVAPGMWLKTAYTEDSGEVVIVSDKLIYRRRKAKKETK